VDEGASIDQEACLDCGFVWDAVTLPQVRARMAPASTRLAAIFASPAVDLRRRPFPDVWSPVEYGAHVRDVLLNLRDRIIVGLAEDNPSPKPMYGALRVDLGLYQVSSPTDLSLDLASASRLFDQTVAVLSTADGERPIFYGWPRPATRTLCWVAAQALHEVEHHLADVECFTSA
jgi:hypothetical protein